jgi:hypothetical protein
MPWLPTRSHATTVSPATSAEIGHQRFHRVVHLADRDLVPWPGRVRALVSGPVQLSITLLQRLQRPVLLQGNHDRLDLASAEDHLMIGDIGAGRQRTLAHAIERTLRRRPGAGEPSDRAARWRAELCRAKQPTNCGTHPTR